MNDKSINIFNDQEVEDYIDLGTWTEIRRLLIEYEKNNN